MSVIGSNIIAGASGTVETGYQISRSLRFNSADSAYLNRTPGTAGNRKTWTWSGWVKRSALGGAGPSLFGCQTGAGNPRDGFQFATDQLYYQANTGGSTWDVDLKATQVFRDPAAQYHIVLAADTTQATASNRLKIYVNGVQITAFTSATYPALNADLPTNQAQIHYIGASFAANYLDGYLSDVRFIDGQALTPSSFGETDANTGVWVPKAYTGTYGTNGFWLKFDDNSGVTATTLGKDSSGNGNNWTPNNFSVTAGAGNDSLVDTPTNYGTDTGVGGEVRGNYCVLNAAVNQTQFNLNSPASTGGTLSNGALQALGQASNWNTWIGTIGVTSGKWYWEITEDAEPSSFATIIGITNVAKVTTYTVTASSFAAGDTMGFALDLDAGTFAWYKNGVFQATLGTGITGEWYPVVALANSNQVTCNFGQRPFAYTAPSGFKALCTQNLPTPAVALPGQNFNALAYSGDGTSPRTISGVGFQPDLVWVKNRGVTNAHTVHDAVRGAGSLKALYTSATVSESGGDTNLYGYLSAFASDGFTVTAGTGATPQSYFNTNGNSFIAWAWKANGAGVSNTAGTITSTVSANTAAGVSVVGYTGNASAGATVGHGLGVAPKMIIVKSRTVATTDWRVWVAALGNARMILNDTSAAVTDNGVLWGNGSTYTAPTSSVFTISANASINTNAATHIAYCFAEVAGFSKFGSYTGNGSTDGPFVYCGFRPRYVLIKRTDTTANWIVWDTARSPYNLIVETLLPNTSGAETTGAGDYIDALSNGFKLRSTGAAGNASGGTYIFAAFAEAPFNYARAR